MNALTKNSTNQDIYDAFGDTLSDGKTRIFAMNPSDSSDEMNPSDPSEKKRKKRNSDRVTLFMCQEITSSSSATEAQKFFLGWGTNKRLLRAVFSAEKKIVDKMNLKAGSVVPFDILITEKEDPAYDGQTAKINPSTGEVITSVDGNPIYEHAELVPVGEGAKVVSLPRKEVIAAEFPGASLLG